jgi:Ca-activated chloride channel family protein
MRSILSAALLALGITAPALAPTTANDSAAATIIVRGVVRDAANGQPLSRVLVESGGVRSLTGADGAYRLTLGALTRGVTVKLRAQLNGYALHEQSLVVRSDSLTCDIVLVRAATAAQLAAHDAVKAQSAQAVTAPASPPMGYTGRMMEVAMMRRVPANMTNGPMRSRRTDARGNGVRDSTVSPSFDREGYDRIEDNPFLAVRANPLSTFSADVDRASYGNVRRFLTQGQRPPVDAVRIEELVNYFTYTLPSPTGRDPLTITSEVIAAPWQPRHRLVRVAMQARRIETAALPPSNLVFLIDVSGSMESPDKLPLVKQSLRLLVDQLRPQDRVAIVVYAGAAGLVLPSTDGERKARIVEAIDRLEAGGSTAGGAGLELAYRVARENFLPNGNNRVILATDGDFNVGASSDAEMERLIERKRADGTYLTVLGFGTGNFQDAKMAKLAKRGNGNYAYVDDINEARKVLVHEMGATLLTVANDVKLQVEFNPAAVQAYRLIGYEDRLLRTEDFTDDRKDAGDIGAGHQVTALYEVVPVGVNGTVKVGTVDALRYEDTPGARPSVNDTRARGELLFVKLRYKQPGDSTSRLLTHPVADKIGARGSDDMRWTAAVASWGMLLRNSEHRGTSSAPQVVELARGALGNDDGGYRAEFLRLVERWRGLDWVSSADARR